LIIKGRQVVIKGPMHLEVLDSEVDTDIGETEVLVKNHYTAISPGTELSIYTGTNPLVYQPNSWCSYPHVPGYAGLGEAIAVGSSVQGIKLGDAVFHHSHHSEYERVETRWFPCAKIDHSQLVPEVSLIRFAGIVMSGSIRLSKIELGDKIILIGLGLIGQIAAQLFTLAGADVYGFDPIEARRKLADQIGATLSTHDPGTTAPKEFAKSLTEGRGVDTLLDATGQSALILGNIEVVRPLGQVILLGAPFAAYETNLTALLRQIFLKRLKVVGALELDRITSPNEYFSHPYLFDVGYSLELIRRGKLKTKPLVSHVLPPSEFKQGYDGLLNKKDEYTAVVIDWSQR
jgi:2-desacetyl-2-hydroxyethyl bacteriochlorophyllide A dehydrogenase